MEGAALPLTFVSSFVGSGLSLQKPVTIARPTELPVARCCRQRKRFSPKRCRRFLSSFPRWHDEPFEKHIVAFNIGREASVDTIIDIGLRGMRMYGSSNDCDGLQDQDPPTSPMGAHDCGEDGITENAPNLEENVFGFSDTSVVVNVSNTCSSTAVLGIIDGSNGASEVHSASAQDGAIGVAAAEDPETAGSGVVTPNDTTTSDSGIATRDTDVRKSRVKAKGGRVRLKWGMDIDLEVPMILEQLVWGPWDPKGEMWTKQVDMAVQVISRSDGVVFFDQLASIINPREGPSRQSDETVVVRLLVELKGVPEVTNDGDILYVFPDLVREKAARSRRDDSAGERSYPFPVEVMQFEEVPGLMATLPRIPKDGPKAVASFFQRAALTGIALFISQCFLLLKLIFGSSPVWLAIGPIYLVWAAVDEVFRRSRDKAARERDRWRAEWAHVCRGDGEAVWRKRASARLRARQLAEAGM